MTLAAELLLEADWELLLDGAADDGLALSRSGSPASAAHCCIARRNSGKLHAVSGRVSISAVTASHAPDVSRVIDVHLFKAAKHHVVHLVAVVRVPAHRGGRRVPRQYVRDLLARYQPVRVGVE